MAISKQDFYEGAAVYLLARTGNATSIRYDPPFFLINASLLVYLKYSTRTRSPWEEQRKIRRREGEVIHRA